MPSKIKEKLALSKEKIKEQAKKFKPKLVISKLRHEGPAGARRCAWLILGIILYLLEWSVVPQYSIPGNSLQNIVISGVFWIL